MPSVEESEKWGDGGTLEPRWNGGLRCHGAMRRVSTPTHFNIFQIFHLFVPIWLSSIFSTSVHTCTLQYLPLFYRIFGDECHTYTTYTTPYFLKQNSEFKGVVHAYKLQCFLCRHILFSAPECPLCKRPTHVNYSNHL